jgi:DMSO/TMAO reductase YedYZ molybdopterin-dependent catalytic subunit/mono/diheme cytochrome c family protein
MSRRPSPASEASSRRDFLRATLGLGAGLALGAAACAVPAPPPPVDDAPPPPDPPAPDPAAPATLYGLDLSLFHLHGRNPLTLETRRSAYGFAVITPMSRFFVRNNLPMPDEGILADRDGWELEIAGVARPTRLSVAVLKQLGVETVTTVLQCSGNGRSFFEHAPSGSNWSVGAAGCAQWTGVPVRRVIEALGGAVADAVYLTSTGGETLPDGVDPLDVLVERSIPIEKALDDCLLAWDMNGEPIPLTHGGPLRLIVPGYYGCNQIKYVRKIAFTAEQTQAKIQRSGYRMRPIGQKGGQDQPSMWAMNVKSWVNGPGAEGEPVLAGTVHFHGVAFSSGAPITRVECSLDGGATWAPARLTGPDLGRYAWRTFAFAAELPPGEHRIVSRATDASGETQPPERLENERGYGHNGWKDHALTVRTVATLPRRTPAAAASTRPDPTVAPTRTVALDERAEAGKRVMVSDASPPCGACHTLGDAGIQGAVGPNLDELAPDAARVRAAVTNGVGAMPPYKDGLSPDQISDLAHYVELVTRKP